MTYVNPNYKPSKKNAIILDAAWEYIQGVPYPVTSRWTFYRLYQNGYYTKKKDYRTKWVDLVSTARKSFYKNWRPDTLVDDTRVVVSRGNGFVDVDKWKGAINDYGVSCDISHWPEQERYVELWFEANAMLAQFRYYTQGITLRPFGGKPSIDYKSKMAKELERASRKYGKPITVLYFGDLDPAGMEIPQSAINDVREWCNVDFEVVRCGLNPGDEVKYNIPENFENPGAYQWEALGDKAAKELIQTSVAKHVNLSVLTEIAKREAMEAAKLRPFTELFASDSPIYTRGHLPKTETNTPEP